MNVAFLFNSDHPTLGSFYGYPIMKAILGSGVLQKASRNMKVGMGDILTHRASRTRSEIAKVCEKTYTPVSLDLLRYSGLEETFGKATVFSWTFQNMAEADARSLDDALDSLPYYLGAMDFDFAVTAHLVMFRLPEFYRLDGRKCWSFYSIGLEEEADAGFTEEFKSFGFEIATEDTGGRRTIFDDFDTPEHFARVKAFSQTFERFDGLDHDAVSDLAMALEELHPKVFDGFAAAARALERAETDEDLAQVALSGRRLLEQIADHLFPAKNELFEGRKVGQGQYKNRLCAYLKITAGDAGKGTPQSLIEELDRLVDLFNAGLHAARSREEVEAALRDLSLWLIAVVDLDRSKARRPYLAYNENIIAMLRTSISNRRQRED